MDCNVYVGRRQSAINSLPSGFVPAQIVDVRSQKHVLYVGGPGSDWDVKRGIVRRRRVKDESCTAGALSGVVHLLEALHGASVLEAINPRVEQN